MESLCNLTIIMSFWVYPTYQRSGKDHRGFITRYNKSSWPEYDLIHTQMIKSEPIIPNMFARFIPNAFE